MGFLRFISIASFITSSSAIAYKNYKADKKIEESGYVIGEDKRSFKEKFYSFVKDYSYLLIPGLNLFTVANELIKDRDDYIKERINKLSSYGRISKKDDKKEAEKIKQTTKKIEEEIKKTKPVEKKETKKEVKKESKVDNMSFVDQMEYYENHVVNLPLKEQIECYEKLDSIYRKQHELLTKSNGSVKERNNLVRKTIEVDKKLESLYRQLKLEQLKDERDRVTSNSMKLK